MSAGWIVAIILGIGAVAYFLAAQRARTQSASADRSKGETPHSLPAYHGWLAFIAATLPALEADTGMLEQVAALHRVFSLRGCSGTQA